MKNILRLSIFASFCSVLISPSAMGDYSQHEETEGFVTRMVTEHQFEKAEVLTLLSRAKKQQSILDAIARPAEKTKEWFEYRDIFIQQSRIDQGVEFWHDNQKTIDRAAAEYGVAQEIIVAIIGVETRYGRHAGKYRVLDALATLGFDYPKRGKFFRSELEHFLLLAREQKRDPLGLTGSYAGAMGYGQFIPSSYRAYAVDFDGDDIIDIWQNPSDAIGSVANYFKRHHWQENKPVLARIRINEGYDKALLNSKAKPKLTLKELESKGFSLVNLAVNDDAKAMPLMVVGDHGKEFWMGFDNFYVITRYNRSHLYAMAVWQLSQRIKDSFLEAAKMKPGKVPVKANTLSQK